MFQNLLDLLFPKQCINCQTPGEYLCKKCKKTLIPHPEICPYCHKFSPDYKTCLDCKANLHPPLEGLIIPFSYTKLMKKLILKLKYYHKKDISDFLAERLILGIMSNKEIQNQSQYKIGYVPSHRFRHYFIKGYNQAQILAKKLGQKSGFPVINFAAKTRHTHTQAGLDRNRRLINLQNAFNVKENNNITGNETIFIVDDVTTTGATINELARKIKEIYPKIQIWGLVLARNNK